jgi:hypothetical protein
MLFLSCVCVCVCVACTYIYKFLLFLFFLSSIISTYTTSSTWKRARELREFERGTHGDYHHTHVWALALYGGYFFRFLAFFFAFRDGRGARSFILIASSPPYLSGMMIILPYHQTFIFAHKFFLFFFFLSLLISFLQWMSEWKSRTKEFKSNFNCLLQICTIEEQLQSSSGGNLFRLFRLTLVLFGCPLAIGAQCL